MLKKMISLLMGGLFPFISTAAEGDYDSENFDTFEDQVLTITEIKFENGQRLEIPKGVTLKDLYEDSEFMELYENLSGETLSPESLDSQAAVIFMQ
ncbi:MAG: hypothetical protein H6622_17995 [Halobacteriovoraceae bacterium]|nr:hypothetical protein [Halobacteriovoraceae bacterium]